MKMKKKKERKKDKNVYLVYGVHQYMRSGEENNRIYVIGSGSKNFGLIILDFWSQVGKGKQLDVMHMSCFYPPTSI